MFQERAYQNELVQGIDTAWENPETKNVLVVLPTGGGKTHVFTQRMARHSEPCIAIAHRQELVTQISLALSRHEIQHRIIGPRETVRLAERLHLDESNRSFVRPNAPVAVAGVDTLIRPKRLAEHERFLKSVTLWVQDEAHHLLRANKWGTAVRLFPNSVGLGVTATPERADGQGLGRRADGVFDEMIVGPTMRELINSAYLTDYRVFAPLTEIDLSNVKISDATHDYVQNQLVKATRASKIVGDVVREYLRIAPGKRGVTFVTDVQSARDVAAAFCQAGVPAAAISADTDPIERARLIRKLRTGELLQLINVDLFGEGFDLPAIEVVIMARKTESFAVYCQQFGRALRPLAGKDRAIIIDHVGNAFRHGLPDQARVWSLDRREKRSGGSSSNALRKCSACTAVYPRVQRTCPECGHVEVPALRTGPEHVDGDLTELDPAVLAKLRGEVERVNGPARYPANAPQMVRVAIHKRHGERQEAQEALRWSIAWWAGAQQALGRSDSESYRRFYLQFGIDVLSAQALGRPDAIKLADKVNAYLAKTLING
jgi:superfamily II DNA or RNA helicase